MAKPSIKQNPHPKLRYDITMAIEDAPGPFESVTGFLQYKVANKSCVPEDPLAGVSVTPSTNPTFTFTRISDNVYTTTIFADLIKDDDYYGKGVCHWSLEAVIGELKVHGMTFSPDIDFKEINSSNSNTLYYWKPHYSNAPLAGFNEGGVPYSVYEQAKETSNFFSITMTAKESFK